MIKEIRRILESFRPCFTRLAAFNWFCTVVFGFIVRIDICEVSSIEAFANSGRIATGILQIISLYFHQTIWSKYADWLRTVTLLIPSEEVVKSVIQQEFYHNFRGFNDTAIYRIIMSKSRRQLPDLLALVPSGAKSIHCQVFNAMLSNF